MAKTTEERIADFDAELKAENLRYARGEVSQADMVKFLEKHLSKVNLVRGVKLTPAQTVVLRKKLGKQ